MQPGQLGAAIQNLQTTGVPPPILQFIQQIGQMAPKDLAKGLKDGQIPPFMQLANQLMQQAGVAGPAPTDPPMEAEFQEKMANVKKAMAEIEKIMADRDLINEKAVTERVHQTVQLAGVDYDDQVIKMQRAKLVNEMESGAEQRHNEGVKVGLDFVSKQHQAEQGTQLAHKKIDTSATLEREKLDRAGRAGFNEKGMKSNNKEE
jgi:hypothetical protein